MQEKPPLTDIQTLRARARANIDEGAVTSGYTADRATVLRLLDESLATELVCVLRYRRHHFMARGIHSQSVAQEFLDHSNEEQGHADQIAERIVQLGGAPDFAPNGQAGRSHAEYVAGDTLADMIREDLVAERIAIGIRKPEPKSIRICFAFRGRAYHWNDYLGTCDRRPGREYPHLRR